jgi:hypothetical protein
MFALFRCCGRWVLAFTRFLGDLHFALAIGKLCSTVFMAKQQCGSSGFWLINIGRFGF